MAEVPRHRTAMRRKRLSRPARIAMEKGLIGPGTSVLDYGCGRGDDVRLLQKRGVDARGWDPHYAPDGDVSPADVVLCSYVANVIEDPTERAETLRDAWLKARKGLILSVRSPGEIKCRESHADGCLTSIGTFQRGYTDDQLAKWARRHLDGAHVESLAPGVAYARRRKAGARTTGAAPIEFPQVPNRFAGTPLGDFLEQQASVQASTVRRTDFVARGPAELLIHPRSRARYWTAADEATDPLVHRMLQNPSICRLKMCFNNAALAALTYPDVRYVEGFAAAAGVPFPVHHAWNLLPDGTIVDCTWCTHGAQQTGLEYIGFVVPDELLERWLKNEEPPGIFDWTKHHDIAEYLTHPPAWMWEPERPTVGSAPDYMRLRESLEPRLRSYVPFSMADPRGEAWDFEQRYGGPLCWAEAPSAHGTHPCGVVLSWRELSSAMRALAATTLVQMFPSGVLTLPSEVWHLADNREEATGRVIHNAIRALAQQWFRHPSRDAVPDDDYEDMQTTWIGRLLDRVPVQEGVEAPVAWRTVGTPPYAEIQQWLAPTSRLRRPETQLLHPADIHDERRLRNRIDSCWGTPAEYECALSGWLHIEELNNSQLVIAAFIGLEMGWSRMEELLSTEHLIEVRARERLHWEIQRYPRGPEAGPRPTEDEQLELYQRQGRHAALETWHLINEFTNDAFSGRLREEEIREAREALNTLAIPLWPASLRPWVGGATQYLGLLWAFIEGRHQAPINVANIVGLHAAKPWLEAEDVPIHTLRDRSSWAVWRHFILLWWSRVTRATAAYRREA